ncbi:hypothetical protein JOD43_000849 [Pullulanibacillus pueri]|nr:hypothetical protein [Pullulanibacillus pueri]
MTNLKQQHAEGTAEELMERLTPTFREAIDVLLVGLKNK